MKKLIHVISLAVSVDWVDSCCLAQDQAIGYAVLNVHV